MARAQMPSRYRELVDVRPWVRFWARNFDYLFVFAPLSVVMDLNFPLWREWFWFNTLWVWLLSTLLWIPIEAFCLSHWGATPGKALLRAKVIGPRPHISYAQAFKRASLVWTEGMACGVIIATQVMQWRAYRDLTLHLSTDWDRKAHTRVDHHRIGPWRTVLFVLAMLFLDGIGPALSGEFSRLLFMDQVFLPWWP